MNETIHSPGTAVPAQPPPQEEQEETYIWDQKDHPFTRPAGSGFELMFRSIVNSLFREGIITGKGGLVDCGCQLGEHAVEYATLRGNQPVYAIDPGVQNLRQLKRAGRHLQNLNIIFGALSSELKTVKGDAMGFMGGHSSLNVNVFTLDSMFFEKGERLAFAHLDVEGEELNTLIGARRTIDRDRPIYTTEVRVQFNHTYTLALLREIYSHGYDSYMIDEACGVNVDARNLINVPREKTYYLQFSDIFNVATAAKIMFLVDETNILAKAFPCCAPGGECCPNVTTDCCTESVVKAYRANTNLTGGYHFSYFFKKQRWQAMKKFAALCRRSKLTNAELKLPR